MVCFCLFRLCDSSYGSGLYMYLYMTWTADWFSSFSFMMTCLTVCCDSLVAWGQSSPWLASSFAFTFLGPGICCCVLYSLSTDFTKCNQCDRKCLVHTYYIFILHKFT